MENIRKFSKSWTGRFVMVLFLAPMAFLGMSPPSSGVNGDVVAKVGDVTLVSSQLDNEITKQRNMLIKQGINSKDIDEAALSKSALESWINNSLLEQQVRVLGIGVSDSGITKILKTYPDFMDENNKFSNEKFSQVMSRSGLSKKDLFAMERTRISVQQLTNGIVRTSIYPMSEIDKMISLTLESRNVWLHRIPWQKFKDQVSVKQDEIETYYNNNLQVFKSTPMVDLSYLMVDNKAISIDKSDITEEEVNQQYDSFLTKNNFRDLREFSQILLSGDNAESLSKEIKEKLDNGEDFSKLAKEFSDDPSGESGGVLGKFDPLMFGEDGQKMQSQLANLTLNEVSDPIKNSFGYQIFKVTTDSSDSVPTLTSMRTELVDKAIAYKATVMLADKISAINDMATDGFAIEDIAKQVDLPIMKIKDYKQQNNLSDLSQSQVVKAAFNEFNIQDMSVSNGIDIQDITGNDEGLTVWIQSNNYRPVRQLSIEEAKTEIKEVLEQEKSIVLALDYAKNKAKKVTNKANISQLGLEFKELKAVTRQTALLTKNEQIAAFSKKVDKEEVVAMVTDTVDGVSLIVADKIQSSVESQLPKAQRDKLANQIRDNVGQNHLLDYLDYLKLEIGVEINKDEDAETNL